MGTIWVFVSAMSTVSAVSEWVCWECRYKCVRDGNVCNVCSVCSVCMGGYVYGYVGSIRVIEYDLGMSAMCAVSAVPAWVCRTQ